MCTPLTKVLFLTIWVAVGSQVAQLSAQSTADETDLRFQEYEQKIQALLKTRLPEEKTFVSEVMTKVREGELPERLVETSFKWVLNKHPDSNHPFVYFERVLRIQAKKLELEIPEFDYSVYRQRRER